MLSRLYRITEIRFPYGSVGGVCVCVFIYVFVYYIYSIDMMYLFNSKI